MKAREIVIQLPVEVVDLLKKKRFNEAETAWMERMERAPGDLAFFDGFAREMGRAGAKRRAAELLQILAAVHRERGDARVVTEVLLKAATLAPEDAMLRQELVESLRARFGDRSSFDRYASATGLAGTGALPGAAEDLERFLIYDEGQFFELKTRGIGKVVEMRPELKKLRLKFPTGPDVSFRLDEAAKILKPLSRSHFLVRKHTDRETLQAMARENPAGLLELLFASVERPLSGKEIRENLAGIVAEGAWTRWWNKVKDEPRLHHSTGTPVKYHWKASADHVEDAVREEFDKSTLEGKMALARKHAGRAEELDAHMAAALLTGASRVKERSPATGLEAALLAAEVFARVPHSSEVPSPHDTVEAVLSGEDPGEHVAAIGDPMLRERALELLRGSRAGDWPRILADVFLRTGEPRTLDFVFRELGAAGAAGRVEELLGAILTYPRRYPRQFLWYAQQAARDESLRERLQARQMRQLLEAANQSEFKPWRTRVGALYEEEALFTSLVAKASLPEARQMLAILQGDCNITPLRREALRHLIVRQFPEFAEKDTRFYVTQAALAKKREEYRYLTEVEIPRNSTDIGRAAAHGDLRENAEYKAARERQLVLMSQAHALAGELERARLIDFGLLTPGKVGVGSRAQVRNLATGEQFDVTILGPWDSDPERHIISYLTPLGEDFLEKTAGARVVVDGAECEIVSITPVEAGS